MKNILLSMMALIFISQVGFTEPHKIDKSHSSIAFEVKHLTIATVPGFFSDYTAKISWDAKNLEKSSFEGEVMVDSINTNNTKRDAHLKADDFFNAKKYPKIYFKSSSITKGNEKGSYQLKGKLTIRNVSKDVSTILKVAGPVKDPWGKERMVFATEFEIDRFDYDIKFNKTIETGGLVVSKKVKLKVEIETIL